MTGGPDKIRCGVGGAPLVSAEIQRHEPENESEKP